MSDLRISASAIALYNDCPRADRLRNIDNVPPLPKRESYALGTHVHAGLEAAARAVLADPTAARAAADPRTLPDFLPAGAEPKTHKGARKILRDIATSLDLRHAIAAEQRFELEMAPNLPMFGTSKIIAVGVMDRVDRIDKTIHIWDYKSSGFPKSHEELACDPQAGLYLVAAKRLYPDAERVRVCYWWLDSVVKVTVVWDEDIVAISVACCRNWREGSPAIACSTATDHASSGVA